jgi:hypothetical protein
MARSAPPSDTAHRARRWNCVIGASACPGQAAVLASECRDRHIADKQILAHELNAWQRHRNKHHAKANWQFRTADAGVKLK